MMCLCLNDSSQKLQTETFSQAFALPNDVVRKLEELTSSTYSLRWSGLSVSLVDVLQSNWTDFLAGNNNNEQQQQQSSTITTITTNNNHYQQQQQQSPTPTTTITTNNNNNHYQQQQSPPTTTITTNNNNNHQQQQQQSPTTTTITNNNNNHHHNNQQQQSPPTITNNHHHQFEYSADCSLVYVKLWDDHRTMSKRCRIHEMRYIVDKHSLSSGVPKRQVVTLAAKALAGQYRETMERNSSLIEKSITL